MNIGLYFGSFNPIHIGHLIIANHILNETDLEKIWFIVSPQNPFKQASSLLNEYDRLHLARLATQTDNRMGVSDIEFKLPRPSFTSDTLIHLSEKHPGDTLSIIMGSDSFQNIEKWKNYKFIIDNYTIYIYNRPGFEIKEVPKGNILLVNAPLIQISSTDIRSLLKKGKSIRYLVPEEVREEIETRRFYKKSH